jgi:hypothetical protein
MPLDKQWEGGEKEEGKEKKKKVFEACLPGTRMDPVRQW